MFGQVMVPTSRFGELRREMDRLFDAFGTGPAARPFARTAGYPALNVWDGGETLCVEAELPGVKQDDLEILVVGNELTIKGCRPPAEGEWTYHRQERGVGEFSRSITMPCEVNADRVEAVSDAGVLMLRLPKADAAKPKQIRVKTA